MDELTLIDKEIEELERKIEPWAIRGKWSDSTPDIDVLANPRRYDVWFWSQCHDKEGRPLFNLDFLGKWRTTDEVPAESDVHPRRATSLRARRNEILKDLPQSQGDDKEIQ